MNTVPTTPTMKKATNAIINPIIAKVILERAAEIFALSPPDVIHPIPPKIRNMIASMTAIISIIVTALPITLDVTAIPPVGTPFGAVIV